MMKASSLSARIALYNRGRESERLALKYRAMRADPFAFLRGTCHLFHADLPARALLRNAPAAWICADLHLENFGTYKGDNRLVYFDINDFDEAALAPCTWEIARAATSILVASKPIGLATDAATALCRRYLSAYAETLAGGKARWIDRDAATGLLAKLFDNVRERKRADFIASRTLLHKGKMTLNTDGRKALPVAAAQRAKVTAFMRQFAAARDDPGFYRVIDVARRIAGLGSLGIERYVILIHGKGGPEGHYLLDLKQALPSALAPFLATPQPAWRTQAERVVAIQHRMQAVSPAFLHAVTLGATSYVLKGLQPDQDRIHLEDARGNQALLETLAGELGRLTAWDQLRASGRQGAANADALIAFGSKPRWIDEMLDIAAGCADKNERAWKEWIIPSSD